jgi:hypothetical protein
LRQHLVIGDLAAIPASLPGRGCRQCSATSFGLSNQRIVCAAIGHAFERHQMGAGIDNANAANLFEFFGLFDGGIDDDIAAFLG